MGLWERQVLPRVTDRVLDDPQLDRRRAETCAGLAGRVLELGFGSGLNVPHYPPSVTEVAAVEPSDVAWRLAQPRVARSAVPVRRSGLDGQRVDEPAGAFDAVLVTFALCTIPDHVAALREAVRILAPGGALHFLEHGSAPDAGVARWQRRLEPLHRRLGGGCHLTRQPVTAVEAAGFEVESIREGYLPGPALNRPFAYLYQGLAHKAAA